MLFVETIKTRRERKQERHGSKRKERVRNIQLGKKAFVQEEVEEEEEEEKKSVLEKIMIDHYTVRRHDKKMDFALIVYNAARDGSLHRLRIPTSFQGHNSIGKEGKEKKIIASMVLLINLCNERFEILDFGHEF
ncbi:protein fem-1 CG6966-like isoform X1 [Vespula maculifrons]|uniref:Protein fem-1 CG6966-like isoform X1 n=1 Tax=Vespula maculifrons TaxID=7453 RepID=A0ABD2CE58_VESMC